MYTDQQLAAYRKQVQPLIDKGMTPQQIMDMAHTALARILINEPGSVFDAGSKASKLMAIKNVLVALYPVELTGYEPKMDN
jgi:outer membrane receptor for monomeric catechols